MSIHEVQVTYTNPEDDVRGKSVLSEAKRTLGITGLAAVRTARVFRLEDVTPDETERLTEALLCEPINQEYSVDGEKVLLPETPYAIEVAYKPGVMNPESGSIIKAANDLSIKPAAADSSTVYEFYGDISPSDVEAIRDGLLINKTVQRVVEEPPETLVITGTAGPVEIIPIRDAMAVDLIKLSEDRDLHLNFTEMDIIRHFFNQIGREPTDCEIELIAGRWSEHCGHKTFKARVIAEGLEKPPLINRIKDASKQYFGDLVISAYKDNSGVIRFYEGQAICGKVETHNSPSAIEPYAGANTGSGGGYRDIMGTGQGAKVNVSTDAFCFAEPSLDKAELPPGCLHPDYIQRRVVAGVRDYGNRMGIPTNNGSVHYHKDFRAKPTVIVGAYGILPEERAQKGEPQLNDLVVVIGGRTGRDGIHGATFSSGVMTDKTVTVNSSAVQIGNAIEEKRMADAILEARDCNLIRAITDCGAAGFSSAIGEMGENIGVTVDISKAPLKYSGLAPWETWMSESQERMVLAIDPKNIEEFNRICRKYNVEATVLGHFDGSHKLTVKHGDLMVADLDYNFLEHGLPQRVMEAKYKDTKLDEKEPDVPTDWVDTLKKVLSHGNVCSKEPIVRQYDHGVQGTNALPPFSGVNYDGPNDAAVITPILGKPYGMIVSHGMNPVLNNIDPYQGSIWAVTEAMANAVAVGANPRETVLINNYIWPFPDEEAMGSLDQSVDAVVACIHALKIPVISGKDSLSSTYIGKDGKTVIKIPPVLCMSAFGRIPDIKDTVSSDIKKSGSTLCLVGKIDQAMGGSTYFDINGVRGNEVPKIDLETLPKVFDGIHEGIKSGKVLACHDVSEGGIIGAVSEMCFGGDCGVNLNVDTTQRPDNFLFNETAGCFVVEVEDEETAREMFGHLPHVILGTTAEGNKMTVHQGKNTLFTADINELKQAWQEPAQKMFS